MTYSVIIPAYYANAWLVDMTAECLRSLNRTLNWAEVILVDDGSPIAAHHDAKYIGIRLPENQGYSAAVNVGLEAATGDILIVGNNDLTFPEKWFTELIRPLEAGYDVATCWTSDQEVKLEDRIEENAKFGSIFAMRREVYEAIGPFDEQFRGYFADLDYRQRMLDEGIKIGKNLNFVIPHLAKATYKEVDSADEEYYRAKSLFEIKWGFME